MLPAIAAGVSIASSVAGIVGGLGANSDARKMARRQARATYAQRMEEIRRKRNEYEYTQGYNRAAIGASNIQFSGSAQRHLQAMQSAMANDIAWRHQAAISERSAIRAGAPGGSANFATIAEGAGNIANTIINYKGG